MIKIGMVRELAWGGFTVWGGFRSDTQGELFVFDLCLSKHEVCVHADIGWFGFYIGWVDKGGRR